ncbi:MAG: hypothetical protein HDQ96_06870 [Lachnospiraceae bacterium]|nr:hypothetical protein [Lachnospiraceae bacterium]
MKLEVILDWLERNGYNFVFDGNSQTEINVFSSLSHYKKNSLTWIQKEENYNKLKRPSNISCAVIQSGIKVEFKNVIITDNSKEVFFAILHEFWGEKKQEGSIGKGTVVSDNAEIDPTVIIGCNCCIDGNVVIGAHTVIEHNVVIQGIVRIGENCYIQSGTVIGIDGFGYSIDSYTGKKKMVEHFGGVVIGKDVFIGSHVNIARGTIDDTVVGNGVKIAPSTHIGHNNMIGDDVTIICSSLYGSVKTGAGSYVTASTVQNQMEIGEHTVIGMGSVVTKSVGSNVIAYGIPAKTIKSNDSGL